MSDEMSSIEDFEVLVFKKMDDRLCDFTVLEHRLVCCLLVNQVYGCHQLVLIFVTFNR